MLIKNSRTEKVANIYSSNVKLVTQILNDCTDQSRLEYDLRTNLEKYIQSKYHPLMVDINDININKLIKYISDNDLFQYLKDCSEDWISKVVQHIRAKFDYDGICEQALDIDTPTDIFSKQDLDDIIADKSFYVGLTEEHATQILDMISLIVSKYT